MRLRNLIITCLLASPCSIEASSSLRVLSSQDLHPDQRAFDIRWLSASRALVAAGKRGVVEVALENGAVVSTVIAGGGEPRKAEGRGVFWHSMRLGASREFLAVSGSAFSVGWLGRGQRELTSYPFSLVADLDVSGDRLVVLGTRRDEKGHYAPDGAVAWVGTLSKGLSDLKPVFYSSSGPGAQNMNSCGRLELGVVRFQPDGGFVVIPGVEPGVYLYDAQGSLVHTWETDDIIDAECGLTRENSKRVLTDPLQHYAWHNRIRKLDDVLPLDRGPGLLLRTVHAGTTRWELMVLDRRKPDRQERYAVPVTSTHPAAYLRGDVREGEIMLLRLFYTDRLEEQPANASTLLRVALP